jgi:hypothetical protein
MSDTQWEEAIDGKEGLEIKLFIDKNDLDNPYIFAQTFEWDAMCALINAIDPEQFAKTLATVVRDMTQMGLDPNKNYKVNVMKKENILPEPPPEINPTNN